MFAHNRLLEVKLLELEDEAKGTGTLEQDLELLAGHAAACSTTSSTAAAKRLPYRQWCAVVYRAGQKRVVRAHLVGARKELGRVMGLASQLQELRAGRAREAQLRAAAAAGSSGAGKW